MTDDLEKLRFVFELLQTSELKLFVETFTFCNGSVELVGLVLSTIDVAAHPKKSRPYEFYPYPSILLVFLGQADNYRRFIRKRAGMSLPLHTSTSIKVKLVWSEDSELDFDT